MAPYTVIPTGTEQIADESVTLAKLAAEVLNLIHPVGMTFLQLSGSPSPVDMGWNGTWENVSATYAGDFFRVEGGGALAYDGGRQLDQMQRIYGRLRSSGVRSVLPYETTGNGAFALGGGTASNSAGNSGAPVFPNDLYFDSATSTVNGGARTGDETRSVNQTIRIWKRTA